MLIIKGYCIEICNVSNHLNLYKLGIVQSGKDKGKETKNGLAYGVTMKRVIDIIITQERAKEADVTDFNAFLEAYYNISKEVLTEAERVAEKVENALREKV